MNLFFQLTVEHCSNDSFPSIAGCDWRHSELRRSSKELTIYFQEALLHAVQALDAHSILGARGVLGSTLT